MRWYCLIALGLLAGRVLAIAEEGGALAGPAELEQAEHEIRALNDALRGILAREQTNHDQAIALADERLHEEVTGYTDRVYPPVPAIAKLGEWYVEAARIRFGFNVFTPVSPWQRRWIALREADHRLQDDEEEARVALRHLVALRDRLRTQLGLSPIEAR